MQGAVHATSRRRNAPLILGRGRTHGMVKLGDGTRNSGSGTVRAVSSPPRHARTLCRRANVPGLPVYRHWLAVLVGAASRTSGARVTDFPPGDRWRIVARADVRPRMKQVTSGKLSRSAFDPSPGRIPTSDGCLQADIRNRESMKLHDRSSCYRSAMEHRSSWVQQLKRNGVRHASARRPFVEVCDGTCCGAAKFVWDR